MNVESNLYTKISEHQTQSRKQERRKKCKQEDESEIRRNAATKRGGVKGLEDLGNRRLSKGNKKKIIIL